MSKRTVQLYIEDIKLALQKIVMFTEGMSFEVFRDDAKTIDAVVRNIEIIGEASKHIPQDIQLKYPQIPWSLIVGTRNRAIHEYFGIDVEILWQTVIEDIPQLKNEIEKI